MVAVSVIVPVRNGALYIDQALASLAVQTFSDFEIVVVDNGSTDETPALLARWTEREPRLNVVRLDRSQLSGALAHASGLAKGALIARLDADDIASPERLERQVAAMSARPDVGLLGSAALLIDSEGRRIGMMTRPKSDSEIRARQRSHSSLIPSSSMMRAEIFRRAGGYRRGLNISEDFDLWTRMMEHCRAANLGDPLISYRIHGNSITARQPARMGLAWLCVTAAADARRRGEPEPFVGGVPSLRRALPLLGLDRAKALRTIRLRGFANRFSRLLNGAPLPSFAKILWPRAARMLGLSALYRRALDGAVSVPKRESAP